MSTVRLPYVASGNYPGGLNATANEFRLAWMVALGDKAPMMVCDGRLVKAAQRQADWLAANNFDPTNPHLGEGGITANERVRAEGYRLPEWYPVKGNMVESALHYFHDDVPHALAGLIAHSTHHDHMMCLNWFSDHTVFGMGDAGGFFICVTAPKETL